MDEMNSNINPPRLAKGILKRFLRVELLEEVMGDLQEKYIEKIGLGSKRSADISYWYQTLHYLRPFAIRSDLLKRLNPFLMWRHNFKISVRNFRRNKTSFFINLLGLSTGLACVLLIFLWGMDERKMDRFHDQRDHLYQVFQNMSNEGNISTTHSTPWPLARALADEMPEVELASVATPPDWFANQTLILDDKSTRATGHYVDSDYLKMFTYPLLHGDREAALRDKKSIVISRQIADNLFGSVDKAMGRKVSLEGEQDFLVSGVMENISTHSSKRFDFVLQANILIDADEGRRQWRNSGPYTFVKLAKGVDPVEFETKIKKYIHTKTEDTHRELVLQKYSDHYLYGNFENGKQAGGRIEYLRLFSLIALFILFIACINFMNLSTARASRRSKEIGVKKAIGAHRGSLIGQYLGESVLISLCALTVAVLLGLILLPQFNLITGKQLSLGLDPIWMICALGIALATGLLAGSYPALYLSRFKPVDIFQGRITSSYGAIWARRALVIFQFILSVSFIVLVTVLYQQIDYVRHKHLGYDKENVVYLNIEGKVKDNLETFLNEVKNINGVVNASSASESLIGDGNTSHINWEGKDPNLLLSFRVRGASDGLIEMLDFELVQGRGYPKDQAAFGEAVFNEAGIRAMGMEDPIGKVVELWDMDCKIVGVIKDFHFTSMHHKVEPLFFVYAPAFTEKVMIKLAAGKEQEALSNLQDFYADYNPEFTFSYRFLDNDYQDLYVGEQRIALLARFSAGLAILISCLGLFGLVVFSAQRRRKEIGIRKVLGASDFSVVRLLGKEFSNLVLMAIIVALPVSYFIAKSWLNGFTYKIDLHWWTFVGGGAIALLIAWLTVSIQTLQAARMNPRHSLQSD